MNIKNQKQDDSNDFSLALGGPLYQFYLRTRLAQPPLKLYKRRMIVISMFAWLPLLLLSILSGLAFSGVQLPFLFDIETHARLLVALTLLIAADLLIHQRMRIIIPQFIEHDIVAPEDHQQFKKIIASAMRLRNSTVIELLLLVLAVTCGHWVWKQFILMDVATWYATTVDNTISLTPAGYWYVFISLPLFQFIGYRWYFRIFIWYRFLWQVARLPLRFNSLHPDKSGGLSFLVNSMFAFAPILIAHSVLLAGIIINRIWHQGASLMQFELEIIGLIVFLVLLVILPLTFFMFQLAKAKRVGLREFSMTSSQYVKDFHQKWIGTDLEKTKALLGTSDIQSLADLANSYNVVREMRLVPFSRGDLFALIILIVLPLLPLLLTVIPLEEIINRMVNVVL